MIFNIVLKNRYISHRRGVASILELAVILMDDHHINKQQGQMTKPTIIIRQANLDDSEQLTDFRISQFKTAKEFELLGTKDFSSQYGNVWVATRDSEIISTMQAEILANIYLLNSKVNCLLPDNFLTFDTLYLSKGATKKEYRNTGLNSLLRLYILQSIIDTTSIKSLSGIAYENAPRLNLLLRLGYEFAEISDWDSSVFKPIGKVFLLRLDRDNFNSAITEIKTETESLYQHFNFEIKTTQHLC
ncbi:MAG: hypothetical protein U0T84_07010 [Chitinophagales bacterium]